MEGIDLVLFVVLDCLRRDHLSLYGYQSETTPFLRSIAESSAVFTNAISPSNWTYPAVTSLLSGLYPHSHGGVFKEKMRNFSSTMLPLKPRYDVLQIQDILALNGFETHFLTSVKTSELPIENTFQFQITLETSADELIKRIVSLVKKAKRRQKKFIYLQLGDLHQPIHPPLAFRNHFGAIKDLPNIEGWDFLDCPGDDDPKFIEFRENKIRLYDATLFYLDCQIKKLIEYFQSTGILETSLLVITADHGEELWDHKDIERQHFHDPRGYFGGGHGHSFFQEVISVPLVILGGNVRTGKYLHAVSLVDIVPTLRKILGFQTANHFDGVDLFTEYKDRMILSEENAYGYEKFAILYKNFKMLLSAHEHIEWFFDLSEDCREESPMMYDNCRNEFRKMRLYADSIGGKNLGEVLRVDEEVKKELTQLGYF
jgi:arylsulfatase A-like enzyme